MPKLKKTKTPMVERRGLQGSMHMPEALCAMLVRADVEQTAGALARDLKTKKWQKSVPRAELPDCELSTPRFYPFQYHGHVWTTVVHRFAFYDDVARRISAALRTRALCAGYEDTSYCFDYALYDSARLVEVFHWGTPGEFSSLTPAEFAQVEERGAFSCAPHGYFAASKVRKLDGADFRDLSNKVRKQFGDHLDHLFDDFLRSQDAFLAFNIMDEPGKEYFPLAEASDDDLVRIDVVEK
jgi:hypothetical protein